MLDKLIKKPSIGIGIIATFHFFGFLGLFTPFKDWFIALTPLNLLISLLVLITYHKGKKRKLMLFFVLCYLIGFGAEYLGVNYGLIFGDYEYGSVLGPVWFGVPALIGVNWFIVSYCAIHLSTRANPKWHFAIITGALITVALDYLIEPVAIKLGYWWWNTADIPLSNYIGWFIVSLIILSIFKLMKIESKNSIAIPLLLIQAAFFLFVQLFFS